MKISKIARQIKITIDEDEVREDEVHNPEDFLSSGSTLLNLAISDTPHGAFLKGRYVFLVGDSSSGKTFLSMTCNAEAMANPVFEDYDLIYDNVEDGMLLNVRKLFGKRVAQRLRAPATDKAGNPVMSSTIEEFYFNVDDARKRQRPFIYVLDSMDALTSEQEDAKFDEAKVAHRKGKEIAGSYGDGKAKKNASGLRRLLSGLRETGSILIIICQTRDAINAMFGQTKSRSGGRALRFYATTEIWSSVTGSITKTVNGRPRKIGTKIRLQTQKNRVTGKLHEVNLAIYPSYGIDDIGSMIDYLVEEKVWRKGESGGKINAGSFGKLARDKLVSLMDEDRNKAKLIALVAKTWERVDRDARMSRKARYV